MLRNTSVVMTTTGASPLMALSPVSSPTLAAPCRSDQVVVLLVGQRLDRRGVEALAALRQRQVHRELADHRLARAGRGADQHAAALLQRLARLVLERVQLEGELAANSVSAGRRAACSARRRAAAYRSAGLVIASRLSGAAAVCKEGALHRPYSVWKGRPCPKPAVRQAEPVATELARRCMPGRAVMVIGSGQVRSPSA